MVKDSEQAVFSQALIDRVAAARDIVIAKVIAENAIRSSHASVKDRADAFKMVLLSRSIPLLVSGMTSFLMVSQ
jgi:hypothetical protein